MHIKKKKAKYTQVIDAANEIFRNTGSNRQIHLRWLPRFFKRNPGSIIRKQKPIVYIRKIAENPTQLLGRFNEYRQLKIEFGIVDKDIWNFDETGLRIGIGRNQYVIIKDYYRKMTIQNPENREFITVIETINAVGKTIALYFIISGRQYLEKWFELNTINENISIDVNDTGYSNDDIAMGYFEYFYENTLPINE